MKTVREHNKGLFSALIAQIVTIDPMTVKRAIRRLLGSPLSDHLFYCRHHWRQLTALGLPTGKAEGEADYHAYWRRLSPWVDPYSYRLYSHFCGTRREIIPFDLLGHVVEPLLNPPAHWAEYEDKNRFNIYVGADCLPQTVARCEGGRMTIESELTPAAIGTPLFLKPSVDRSCGEGILRFDRVGESYRTAEGVELTEAFLRAYGPDFVLQEAIEQHPFMQRLSPTAVATLRLAVYRSVHDGTPHVTGAVLRVGERGAVVDNIVAGGRFIGIDISDGSLGGCFVERNGARGPVWNGVDLSAERLQVPAWNEVLALACRVAGAMGPHHLLALDIALTPQEKPMLIEYNIGGFSSYLFHFTGQTVFGPWTDEVVAYCLEQRGKKS